MAIPFPFSASLAKAPAGRYNMTRKGSRKRDLRTRCVTLMPAKLTGLRAFSYMVYLLLSIPCVMSLQALWREYGQRFMLLSVALMLIIPYMTSFVIFQLLSLVM